MLKSIALILFLFLNSLLSAQMSHDLWNQLLNQYVTKEGFVSYKNFRTDSSKLNEYLHQLETNYPKANWPKDDIKAYWINAYNAYTIKLILQNYPVKGIKEIGGKIPFVNSTWDIHFININGEKKDLNYIEHRMLRKKFSDPRIHMALVCASNSCPILRNEAYSGDHVNEQLDDQAKKFLADPFRNKITAREAQLSMIFKWYGSDFSKAGGVTNFINKYSSNKITPDTNIKYLNYDWGLNGE